MDIGQILRDTREEMGFSEKEVADDLAIPLKFIVSLEKGEWAKLPARIYARGFLKKYAAYLELQSEEVLKEFDEEWTRATPSEISESVHSRIIKRNPLSFVNQRYLLILIFLAAIFVVGLYFLYEFRFVIRPPEFVITTPAEDETTTLDSFPVSGKIEKESVLTLNGRSIYTNEKGEFSDSALLSKGLNMLEFEAKNRFGKTNKVVRYILVK